MFRLKGSRRRPNWNIGSPSVIEPCSGCGYHSCECKTQAANNIQNEFQKDLKKLITKIDAGRYGKPEKWKGLRDDLAGLLSRLQAGKI